MRKPPYVCHKFIKYCPMFKIFDDLSMFWLVMTTFFTAHAQKRHFASFLLNFDSIRWINDSQVHTSEDIAQCPNADGTQCELTIL